MEIQGLFRILSVVLITCVLGTVGFIILLFFNLFSAGEAFKRSAEKIESKELITPEIRLEINNNKVDTVYVYEVK